MAGKAPVRIWVGTRKGAFVFTSKDRKKWEVGGPFFAGQEVHHVAQDPRDPKRHYAAVGNAWFGPHLHASADRGKTWQLSEKGLECKGILGKMWQVTEKGSEMKEVADAPLKRIWNITPGAADEPGVVYLGGDPGVLFRSGDYWRDVGDGGRLEPSCDAREMESRRGRDDGALDRSSRQRTAGGGNFGGGRVPLQGFGQDLGAV